MNTKKLQFEVELDEANLILKALGKLPFEEVYDLIGKLNSQANNQLNKSNDTKVFENILKS